MNCFSHSTASIDDGDQTGWMNKFGEQLDFPLDGQAETKCPYSGKKYILAGKELKITGSEQCN